jgi:hypothetical protein
MNGGFMGEQGLPPQAAGNFLLIGKKSPKKDCFSRRGCGPRTARPCCWPRTRASLRATTVVVSVKLTGIKLLVTPSAQSHGLWRGKSKNAL